MEDSFAELNKLPDEILLIIFKNLDNCHVLYSLFGVNQRLTKIVHDFLFTNHLTLFKHSSSDIISRLSDSMLDRFCSEILPKINDKINWLDIEISSIQRILLVRNYPNLFGLGLYNIETENDVQFLKEDTFIERFQNQLSSFVVKCIDQQETSKTVNTKLFAHIVNTFNNLRYLKFNSLLFYDQHMSWVYSPPLMSSSTLVELHVKVDFFDDCLSLLDGRFDQLRTFYVDVQYTVPRPNVHVNQNKVHNLQCFSLYCFSEIKCYDTKILPLLQQMINLEELYLYLLIKRDNQFVDGNDLKMNIINYTPKLNKIHLNICSMISLKNEIYLPLNEDIQRSFEHFSNLQINSCVNYFPEERMGQCHIYSYPFTIRIYPNIANNFPGGLFRCVIEISLFDEHPFEYEFFHQIAQSFPFLKRLTIRNEKAQCKKSKKLLNIQYPYLEYLHLRRVHDHYIEQFLIDSKTYLPFHVMFFSDYQSLKRITHNFTRKATQTNCAKLTYRCIERIPRFPKHFQSYFFKTTTLKL